MIIVDIDGTISKVGERLKYLLQAKKDWDSFYNDCFDDEPIQEIIDLVYALYLRGETVVFCTGRRESCREKTINWIDPAGYLLAKTEKPEKWSGEYIDKYDFILKPLEAHVIAQQ